MEDKGIPNLDCSSFGDLEAFGWVFMNLHRYCMLKREAIRCREGNGTLSISRALECETQCDRLYEQLPEWARW